VIDQQDLQSTLPRDSGAEQTGRPGADDDGIESWHAVDYRGARRAA
jgi:hypothetical protein